MLISLFVVDHSQGRSSDIHMWPVLVCKIVICAPVANAWLAFVGIDKVTAEALDTSTIFPLSARTSS